MIMRIWKARATMEGAKKYRQHFEQNVIPELKRLTGFQHAYLLFYGHLDVVDIEVHTVWDSMDAIKKFAIPDVHIAVVEPQAQAVLTGYDKHVSHFDAQCY